MVVHIHHIRLLFIVIELFEVTGCYIHKIILHGIGGTLVHRSHSTRPMARRLPIGHLGDIIGSLWLILVHQFPFVLFDELLLPSEEVCVVGRTAELHAVRV